MLAAKKASGEGGDDAAAQAWLQVRCLYYILAQASFPCSQSFPPSLHVPDASCVAVQPPTPFVTRLQCLWLLVLCAGLPWHLPLSNIWNMWDVLQHLKCAFLEHTGGESQAGV